MHRYRGGGFPSSALQSFEVSLGRNGFDEMNLLSVKVGATVTSLEVVNSMRSSSLRSIPPSAMIVIWIVSFRCFLCIEKAACLGCELRL